MTNHDAETAQAPGAQARIGDHVMSCHTQRCREDWTCTCPTSPDRIGWQCSACGWVADDDTIAHALWADRPGHVSMLCPECLAEGAFVDYTFPLSCTLDAEIAESMKDPEYAAAWHRAAVREATWGMDKRQARRARRRMSLPPASTPEEGSSDE